MQPIKPAYYILCACMLFELTQERSTFSSKFLPSWLTSSTFQLSYTTQKKEDFYTESSAWIDVDVSENLKRTKAINWLRTGVRLYPLKQDSRPGIIIIAL